MKTVLSLTVLMFAFQAQANVKPVGTVLSTQCGDAVESPARAGGFQITKVCKAKIVGQSKEYFTVEEHRATRNPVTSQVTVWEVTKGVGNSRNATFEVLETGYKNADGMFQEKAATVNVTGTLKATILSGGSVYGTMKGELGGRTFTATKFHSVFHTL